MPNLLIDCDFDVDVKDITSEQGGATTNDIRVVVREGLTAAQAHQCLLAITNALIGDQVDLA